MSFLHTLKIEERRILREVVKRVHLKHHPKQFCTDREADKVIPLLALRLLINFFELELTQTLITFKYKPDGDVAKAF